MTYPDVIKFLYDLQLFGAKLGLENTFRLAELVGNPQNRLRFIHVAGTNGKGSTVALTSRILAEAGVSHVDALKIDVEGFEDRVLTGFFADAPQALWPRAIVIEHLSKDEWLNDCIADMRARGYVEKGRTRSNTLLARG